MDVDLALCVQPWAQSGTKDHHVQRAGSSNASRGLASCLEASKVWQYQSGVHSRLSSSNSMVRNVLFQRNAVVLVLCNPVAEYPVAPLSVVRCWLEMSMGLFIPPTWGMYLSHGVRFLNQPVAGGREALEKEVSQCPNEAALLNCFFS